MSKQTKSRTGQTNTKKVTHRIAGVDGQRKTKRRKKMIAGKENTTSSISKSRDESIAGSISGITDGNGLFFLLGGAGLLWFLSNRNSQGSAMSPYIPGLNQGTKETVVEMPSGYPNTEVETPPLTIAEKRQEMANAMREYYAVNPSHGFRPEVAYIIENQVTAADIAIIYDYWIAYQDKLNNPVPQNLIDAATPILLKYGLAD